MLNLFKKNKKKEFKAVCDLTRQPLDKNSTYILTTAEIISSKKFWDNKMTEPETLSYTVAHFKTQDPTASRIRKMIFDKYSDEKAWVVSDAAIHLFDVDTDVAKARGDLWWESEGNDEPQETKDSISSLGSDLENFKNYAIKEAGRSFVSI
jgi:hypothetical protein